MPIYESWFFKKGCFLPNRQFSSKKPAANIWFWQLIFIITFLSKHSNNFFPIPLSPPTTKTNAFLFHIFLSELFFILWRFLMWNIIYIWGDNRKVNPTGSFPDYQIQKLWNTIITRSSTITILRTVRMHDVTSKLLETPK